MADRFQVNGTDPPTGARPYGPDSRLVLPDPTGTDGYGNDVGAVGYPYYVAHFPTLTEAGLAYYLAILGGDALSVELTSLEIWNPYANSGAGDWVIYTHAVMHRPSPGGLKWRGTAYSDVRILFTELY